ncbi:adenosylcobalamin-dependent ribonucleoside-diphosphate reductase [Dehalococcoides mccartyi]|uniref:Vitamin B12-dependent ribonucleotide reductase n=1 Tax=Dehalococcoides mccartyi (strain VS) TaxID=311424 RepID=D2BHB3_DEHMV|nr:adenosylcobalamin-dependent ribonucleoside-diphosphate reductase [Dehalococcoides mccartyi]ACZ61713.1 ribonucleotide reductase, cobalamin-dependent [Dehalococcoides mccartyi VS]
MTVESGRQSVVIAARLSTTAKRVLEKRYLKKDADGRVIETPEDMFHRVARVVASAEYKYAPGADISRIEEEFYQAMFRLEFLPNSPTLLNAGRQVGQLSACFVLPVEDSIESIFDAVKQTALIHKSGGGTGFSFSDLRPAGDKVGELTEVAGGPVSVINIFAAAADYVRQGGVRRGCNAAILDVTHPDILNFISCKGDPNALTNFYISVVVTRDFMTKVRNGEDYDIINPHTGEVVQRLNAACVFDRIVDQAWKTGDPGLVFIDRINDDNPTPLLGRIKHVSGCGEQTLLPYESCNLGSISLPRMLKRDGERVVVDYEKLGRTVKMAIRFLDNVIDVNKFPTPEIEKATLRNRKVGLGVMGFADMLVLMGIPYNSEEAIFQADQIMEFIKETSHRASSKLAEVRGSFPAYEGSIYDVPGGRPMRNATCTSIAPTGTLSIIAGVSSGIEPSFAMVFVRNILDGENLLEINPYFEEMARRGGFHSKELFEKLVSSNHLHDIECIPDWLKRLLVTAHRIRPEWHIRIQAAFQKYTDHAVSKTVNFSHEATREDMANVFNMAYDKGLKGITVYRDGSRAAQPLCTCESGVKLVDQYLDNCSCR